MKENEKPYWIYLFRSQKKKIERKNRTHQLEMSKFPSKCSTTVEKFSKNSSQLFSIFVEISTFSTDMRSANLTLNFFLVLLNYEERHNHFTQVNAVFSFFVGAYKNTIKFEIMNLLLCFTWTNSIHFFLENLVLKRE